MDIQTIIAVQDLVNKGALFVINDSAGKDSQIMKIELLKLIPHDQCVIVHANLPGVEWEGNMFHISKYSEDVPVFEVQAKKTFFEMVEHRQKFPAPKQKQCTSDLKRGPIQVFINNYARAKGFKYVVNCMGLRAQESPARKKKQALTFQPKKSAKHRQQFEWLPVHDMLIDQVFAGIATERQVPHYAYGLGMSRLSCKFCIMSNDRDLKIAAKHDPELAEHYCLTEERLDFTMSMSQRPLRQIINS